MSQYVRQGNRRQSSSGPSFEQRAVEGVLKGLWWLITLPFKAGKAKSSSGTRGPHQVPAVQAKAIAEHWEQVTSYRLAQQTWPLAISEADKLVDLALEAANFSGKTFADRLRSAERYFSQDTYQAVWGAHKLRNSLAHQLGQQVTQNEVNQALYSFERALQTLGVSV